MERFLFLAKEASLELSWWGFRFYKLVKTRKENRNRLTSYSKKWIYVLWYLPGNLVCTILFSENFEFCLFFYSLFITRILWPAPFCLQRFLYCFRFKVESTFFSWNVCTFLFRNQFRHQFGLKMANCSRIYIAHFHGDIYKGIDNFLMAQFRTFFNFASSSTYLNWYLFASCVTHPSGLSVLKIVILFINRKVLTIT